MSRYQNPEKVWKSIKDGYLIQMKKDQRFVRDIICYENVVNVYYTDYAWEAKSWKTIRGALKAANKIPKWYGGTYVRDFVFSEEKQARVLVGYIEALDDAEGA